MSSYVEFWVKNKKGQYTLLLYRSRSDQLYQACYKAGVYGKTVKKDENDFFGTVYAQPFTLNTAALVRSNIREEIERYKKYIVNEKEIINSIWNAANNSIEEKTNAVNELLDSIEESKDDIKQCEAAMSALDFIADVREANKYGREDMDDIIYAGIDACIEGEEDDID